MKSLFVGAYGGPRGSGVGESGQVAVGRGEGQLVGESWPPGSSNI